MPKDVTVNRQVLAEPDAVLATKSWASLEDGTPLVTGEHRGKGIVSLFHVSADMRWSDLPMSGTFVEMLQADRRHVRLHRPARARASPAKATAETVAPLRIARRFRRVRPAALDRQAAAGRLPRPRERRIIRPASTARPTARSRSTRWRPPIASRRSTPRPARAARQLHQRRTARPARHPAVGGAGAVPDRRASIVAAARRRHRGAAAAARGAGRIGRGAGPGGVAGRAVAGPRRQTTDDFAIKATSQTRLAYVVTGNADVDSIVKAGMAGLTLFLAQRTALEAGDPVGVDPAHDELAFFPLIYWPVRARRAEAAAGRASTASTPT